MTAERTEAMANPRDDMDDLREYVREDAKRLTNEVGIDWDEIPAVIADTAVVEFVFQSAKRFGNVRVWDLAEGLGIGEDVEDYL